MERFSSLQAGVQCTCGLFAVALFVFIREARFPNVCLSVTLYVVSSVMMSPDCHVGTKLRGACMLLGPFWLGTLLAGAMVSIAHAAVGHARHSDAFLVVTCVLGLLGLVPVAVIKMRAEPPFLAVMSMVTSIGYLVTVVLGLLAPSLTHFWSQSVSYLLASGALASGVTMMTAVLVLPTTATDEAAECVVNMMRRAGMIASRAASVILERSEEKLDTHLGAGLPVLDGSEEPLPHDAREVDDDVGGQVEDGEPDEDVFLEVLRQTTQPPPATAKQPKRQRTVGDQKVAGDAAPQGGRPRSLPPSATVATLGPIISRARVCLSGAQCEPPLLTGRGPLRFNEWVHLCNALGTLMTRLASLESILETPPVVTAVPANLVVVDSLKEVMARIAGSCVALADTLADIKLKHRREKSKDLDTSSGQRCPEGPGLWCTHLHLYGCSWGSSRDVLRETMREWMVVYWGTVRSSESQQLRISQANMVRQLMFLWTLTTGLTVAMEEVERAVVALIKEEGGQTGPQGSTGHAARSKPVDEESAKDVDEVPSPPPVGPPLLARLFAQLSFLPPLLLVLLNVPVLTAWWSFTTQGLPQLFRSNLVTVKGQMAGRRVQAVFKYWLSLSLTLALFLSLIRKVQHARVPLPTSGIIAAVLCASEKVEATVSKSAVLLVGTVLGGTLGYGLMAGAELANNPYGLMAILCLVTFLVGYFGVGSHYRTAITLILMTFLSVVLCQYHGCCRATGTLRYYLSRVISVLVGCLISVMISNLVLPWYNSTWALDTLADTLQETTKMVGAIYQLFYQEGQAAAKATQLSLKGCSADVTAPTSSPGEQRQQQAEYEEQQRSIVIPQGDDGVPPQEQPSGSDKFVGTGSSPPSRELVLGPGWIQSKVAQPLVAVQVALNQDAVMWRKGMLATPPIVHQALGGMLVLLNRLSALQLTLMAPAVSGHFNGSSFTRFVQPLHKDMCVVLEELRGLSSATSRHLTSGEGNGQETSAALQDHIHRLEVARLAIRRHTISLRREYHLEMRRMDNPCCFMHYTHPDDTVRFLSFLYAFIKYLDKATTMSRIALTSKDKVRCGWNSWLV